LLVGQDRGEGKVARNGDNLRHTGTVDIVKGSQGESPLPRSQDDVRIALGKGLVGMVW
jgi:hypothetical protein